MFSTEDMLWRVSCKCRGKKGVLEVLDLEFSILYKCCYKGLCFVVMEQLIFRDMNPDDASTITLLGLSPQISILRMEHSGPAIAIRPTIKHNTPHQKQQWLLSNNFFFSWSWSKSYKVGKEHVLQEHIFSAEVENIAKWIWIGFWSSSHLWNMCKWVMVAFGPE